MTAAYAAAAAAADAEGAQMQSDGLLDCGGLRAIGFEGLSEGGCAGPARRGRGEA